MRRGSPGAGSRRDRVDLRRDQRLQNEGPAIHQANTNADAASAAAATATVRANATLPKDGSEDFTGYPLLPTADQTNPRQPAKKSQVDAANAAAAAANSAAAAASTNADGRLSRAGGGTVTGTLTLAGELQTRYNGANVFVPAGSEVTVQHDFGYLPRICTWWLLQPSGNRRQLPTSPSAGGLDIYVHEANDTTVRILNVSGTGYNIFGRMS